MTEILWTYALRMSNNVMNETPRFQNPGMKIPQAAFRILSGTKLKALENFRMIDLCSRQRTTSQATKPQVVREIKGGSIFRNITNTLQEYGAGTIPKGRTGMPTISRKF